MTSGDADSDAVKKVLELSGFDKPNPVQELAIEKGLLGKRNMVVAAPTASGKTLIAEIAALRAIRENLKVVYIVPLKALASEKYDEFRKKYEPLGIRVALSVGDRDSSDTWLAKYDIIIVTSEKLDSLLRHGIGWAGQIGLVVADEIHLLDDPSRGPTLEVVLTRLRQDADPRILALSATISNHEEIAGWLDASAVKSEWRPVKLLRGVCFDNKVSFFPKGSIELDPEEANLKELVEQALAKKKQALVFISTRRNAESAAEKASRFVGKGLTAGDRKELGRVAEGVLHALGHPTIQCERLAGCIRSGTAFHHAGLTSEQRGSIEKAFKSGLIKVIAATPTLAAGINLPAWRVIIRDMRRFSAHSGMDFIPVLEIQQMCLTGDAEILTVNGTYEKIKDIIKNDVSVLSLNTNTGKLEEKPITEKFSRHSNELVCLRTNSGKELKATPEHPVLVYQKDILWKQIGDVKKGDMIGTLNKVNVYRKVPKFMDYLDKDIYVKDGRDIIRYLYRHTGKGYKHFAHTLSIPYKTIKSYAYNKSVPLKHILKLSRTLGIKEGDIYKMLENRRFKTKYGSQVVLPINITNEFAWLLGIIAAEGSITEYTGHGRWKGTRYSKLKLSNTNSSIIKKIKSILESLGIRYYEYVGKSGFCPDNHVWKIDVCNQTVIKLLNRFGIQSGKKSYTIEMKEVFELPDNLVSNFIAGLFDGDGNFSSSMPGIRLSSISKDLIKNCQSMFLRFGIRSTVHKEKKSYCLAISRKSDINKFFSNIPCVRIKSKRLSLKRDTRPMKFFGDVVFDTVDTIDKKILKKPITVFNMSVYGNENFVCNNFIVHNCGRAGRPRYDTEGQAILLAGSEADARYAWENYIKGEPERVYSKLGVEPVLRTHVLALVSSGVTPTRSGLMEFFSRTFYAHQYEDSAGLAAIMDRIILMLEEFGFITTNSAQEDAGPFQSAASLGKDIELRATSIGRRVSELYIDPLTANHFIRSLDIARERQPGHIGYLQAMSNTLEMSPMLPVRKGDLEAINDFLNREEKSLIQKPPNPWDIEYDDYLRSVKTAMLFQEWMEEAGEDVLLDRFRVTPGELRVRLSNADWLLYSMQELGLLLGHMGILKDLRKVRVRVSYGIREELLPLVRLKGVGRVRARMLHTSGLRGLEDLRRIPQASLERIMGPGVARQIKGQL